MVVGMPYFKARVSLALRGLLVKSHCMTNRKLRVKYETTVAAITYRLQNEPDYFFYHANHFGTIKL